MKSKRIRNKKLLFIIFFINLMRDRESHSEEYISDEIDEDKGLRKGVVF